MHPLLLCLTTWQRFSFAGYVPQKPRGAFYGFRIPASIVLLAPVMLMACGGGGSTTLHPIATQTSAPTATPTPSPIITTTYQLSEGSTISFAPPLPDLAGIPPEPLSGAFDAVPVPPVPPSPTPSEGNAAALFAIAGIAFQSLHFTVTGNTGGIGTSTIPSPGVVDMALTVSINGQEVQLTGEGPRDLLGNTYPPLIAGLEICGAAGRTVSCDSIHNGSDTGFSLTIFATPQE